MSKNKKLKSKVARNAAAILGVLNPEKPVNEARKSTDSSVEQVESVSEEGLPLPLSKEEINILRELNVDLKWLASKVEAIRVFNTGDLQKGTMNDMYAKSIESHLSIINIMESEEMFFYYEDIDLWIGQAEQLLAIILRQIYSNASKPTIREIIGLISIDTYIRASAVDPKHLLPLNNGVFNLNTWKFEENNPNHFITRRIPVEYNPEAKGGIKIMKFLKSLADKNGAVMLREFWAYCLFPDYPIAKAMLLLGEGSNGKSTYLGLLRRFFGESNCSALSLQQLESEFLVNEIISKMVNLAPDIPALPIQDTSIFKALTGEDMLLANIKYKQPITFKNRAKMIFGANQTPPVPYDQTKAFARRWQIVSFPYSFVSKPSTAQEKPAIEMHSLYKILATPKQFSGWLNILLDDLKEILGKNHFTFESTESQVLSKFAPSAIMAKNDLLDSVIHKDGSILKKQELYDLYVEETGVEDAISFRLFNKLVKRRFPMIKDRRMKRKGREQVYWVDTTIVDLSEEES